MGPAGLSGSRGVAGSRMESTSSGGQCGSRWVLKKAEGGEEGAEGAEESGEVAEWQSDAVEGEAESAEDELRVESSELREAEGKAISDLRIEISEGGEEAGEEESDRTYGTDGTNRTDGGGAGW